MQQSNEDEQADSGFLLSAVPPLLGVIVVAALLLYTLHSAVFGGSERPASAANARPATTASTQASRSTAIVVPAGGYRPEPDLLVFMICDGETVAGAIYDGPIFQQYVTLRPGTDAAIMAALMTGQPTILPSYSRTFTSRCMDRAIQSGVFP